MPRELLLELRLDEETSSFVYFKTGLEISVSAQLLVHAAILVLDASQS